EQVQAKADSLKESIVAFGGIVVSDEYPVLIDLTYSMTKVVGTARHKVNSGYFGWIKFEITREGIEKVKKTFDSKDEVLRFLIIKTVKENTLLNGKMIFKKEERAKKEADDIVEEVHDEPVKERASEDLDKSIDDLVIV